MAGMAGVAGSNGSGGPNAALGAAASGVSGAPDGAGPAGATALAGRPAPADAPDGTSAAMAATGNVVEVVTPDGDEGPEAWLRANPEGAAADIDTDLLHGRQVLVVDDDVRNVFALTAALEQHGMVVRYAENGKDAISQLDSDPAIDLVLMDIMMPGMDGNSTTRTIRTRPEFVGLPIIALTAKAMVGDREKSLVAGASDYVTKPVDVDHLLRVMSTWLTDNDETDA